MQVTTIAANGTVRDYQLQRPIKSIGFRFQAAYADLIEPLDAAFVTVKRYSDALGEKVIIPRMKLKDAIEILGFKSGCLYDDNGQVRTSLDLTFAGAIDSGKNGYISLTIENAPSITDVFAIGDTKSTTDNLKITPIACNANGTTRIQTNGAEAIFLDTSSLSELRVVAGVNTYSLDAQSLQNVSMDFKPSSFIKAGAFSTADNRYHMLELNGVDAVDVLTTGATVVYLLKEKIYEING